MPFSIQHQCPQCGGPVELAETDRVLACPYCGVRNYLAAAGLFRFVLGAPGAHEEVLWAPYFRFRGIVFACDGASVSHRILDLSRRAVSSNALPETLGLRSQTQTLRFVQPSLPGRFLRVAQEPAASLAAAVQAAGGARAGAGPGFGVVYVGEVTSVVYAPLVLRERQVLDGLCGRGLGRLPPGFELGAHSEARHPGAHLRVLPALCPKCGADLDGEGPSAVLLCDNCEGAWEATGGRFVRRAVETEHTRGGDYVYLPFWRMRPVVSGAALSTRADFERLTNQRLRRSDGDSEGVSFWSPAFKIKPASLLRLSRRMTLAQRPPVGRPDLPRSHRHPVTLSLGEAQRAMVVVLADLCMAKSEALPRLAAVKIRAEEATLVYLPFRPAGQEVVHAELHLAVSRSALAFGRCL